MTQQDLKLFGSINLWEKTRQRNLELILLGLDLLPVVGHPTDCNLQQFRQEFRAVSWFVQLGSGIDALEQQVAADFSDIDMLTCDELTQGYQEPLLEVFVGADS